MKKLEMEYIESKMLNQVDNKAKRHLKKDKEKHKLQN